MKLDVENFNTDGMSEDQLMIMRRLAWFAAGYADIEEHRLAVKEKNPEQAKKFLQLAHDCEDIYSIVIKRLREMRGL